jgi:transcription-repair coupling factor (superfamily II helicase)
VPETARPALAAALAARHEGPTLVVVPTPARSHALHEELALYLEHIPLARLPERERLPYELVPDDDVTALERSRAMRLMRGPGRALVVASWAALAEHCAPPAATGSIEVQAGARLAPDDLVRRLEGAGYAIEPLADTPGSAARRGGIVDVFGVQAESPARIEFLGSEVESIRLLDLASQRSTGRVDRIELAPLSTGTAEARERAAALAARLEGETGEAERLIEHLQVVAEGGRTPFAGFIESLLYESTALEALPSEAALLFEDADEGLVALAGAFEHQQRARQEAERRGAIPRGLPHVMAQPSALHQALEERESAAIHVHRFGTEESGFDRLPVSSTPSFAGRLKPFVQQAGEWARRGRTVVVASQQALRLADLAEEEGVAAHLVRRLAEPPAEGAVMLLPLAVGGGFTLEERLVLVTDAEIFGFRKRRRPTRRRPSVREELVSTLEVGDYLVHADHGIARFGGLVRRTIDGIEKEYLELQYAEGDRLYAPVDQLESVTRYIGPADRPPSLTRLGTQEWNRAKRRVRQAIAAMAGELLDLYARRELAQGHAFAPDGPWQMEMEAAFPFVETADQVQAIAEVKGDMEQVRPMDRLICGDVGYGKTEVAVRAAFKAVTDGKQVAVLVPTTVLAEQHGATFRERTAGFPVRVEVLSRFRSEEQQREIVRGVASGDVDIVIGTHRLLQRDIEFHDLGLVVIDEEQRFGVAHKERLKQMRAEVDVLSLSATPIPRTLQMSLSGIRDMSTVMTPPEERLAIRTYVSEWDDEIIRQAIEREMERGGQVYFVHNRVHDIERVVERIRKIVPEADIAVGHGQMPEEQLERVMLEFAAGDHDILVCTTIIESGLDIPNVNTIIIDDANRLGLAQLYQLRGRVGRGANRAYAYLLYDRSRAMSETAQKRLEAIFEATDLGAGFQIALRDLEIRGAGNVLGAEQSGHIAAVGFDMYSKLLAEAVAAVKAALEPGETPTRRLAPPPPIDLPLSAHIPPNYIEDMHARLALYQRVANIETPEQVQEMQAELRDRFGPVPPAVEHLLYVALVKSMARRANVESIKTDEHMFHLRLRGGATDAQRRRVEALRLQGIHVGPRQVRIDRMTAGEGWLPLLARILKALEEGAVEGAPAAAAAG